MPKTFWEVDLAKSSRTVKEEVGRACVGEEAKTGSCQIPERHGAVDDGSHCGKASGCHLGSCSRQAGPVPLSGFLLGLLAALSPSGCPPIPQPVLQRNP